jgi:hypothetical protein
MLGGCIATPDAVVDYSGRVRGRLGTRLVGICPIVAKALLPPADVTRAGVKS